MLTFALEKQELVELAKKHATEYQHGDPFPHIVLDNIFPSAILEEVVREFPTADSSDWIKFKTPYELKLATRSEDQFGSKTKAFMHFLNSQPFLEFLQVLTGIDNLIPDPAFEGGGLHQILPGGFLKIHTDFNKHSKTSLDRRLNVLIYLNKDWKEEYGGHFELWDREMVSSRKKVLPIFNRLAVFTTTDFSYHGHPDQLKCPEGMSRKSIATYYYTNGRPLEEIRPGDDYHNTLFQLRAEDKSLQAREFALSFVPPIMRKSLAGIKRTISNR